jgi:hypothetical protein
MLLSLENEMNEGMEKEKILIIFLIKTIWKQRLGITWCYWFVEDKVRKM